MNDRKIGVWLIGAAGSISATVIMGALALGKKLTAPTGMITATELFSDIDLVPVQAMVFGGCDIRGASLVDSVTRMVGESGCIDPAMVKLVEADLAGIEPYILPGISRNCGEAIESMAAGSPCRIVSLRDEIGRIVDYLFEFRRDRGLDDVVVVNLASTEPPLAMRPCHGDLAAFETCLDSNASDSVRASTIYAYAAIQAGCPYINFTPSPAALFPALVRLAERKGVPVMGNDGKTGETLVKSALAPMFMCRNLEVLSWEGFNILGNNDGRVLACPENKEAKIQTKDRVLAQILGYTPHSGVHIDYVPSLCDQKTAWDFIHFRGFLGAKMSLQFIWQGYDSLLAAPLILDLVRLADLAKRRGEAGLMPQLACYFKAPEGVDEYRLYEQYQLLVDYANRARDKE
jgi:myo-inositol-1-phosphate synthase